MRVAIHQPHYWPWPPYLHKMLCADVFVYLDTVKYSEGGLQNRNKIKTAGGPRWLTLPIDHRSGYSIGEKAIVDAKAPRKHWRLVADSYARSAGLPRWREELEAVFAHVSGSLADAAIASTDWLLAQLGGTCRRVRASELGSIDGTGSTLNAAICAELGATEYLSGSGALAYMDRADFDAVGCAVSVQGWTSPEYEQQFPDQGFVADLSALDLVLNRPDDCAAIVDAAGDWAPAWP